MKLVGTELEEGRRRAGIKLQRSFGHVYPAFVVQRWKLQGDSLCHVRFKEEPSTV